MTQSPPPAPTPSPGSPDRRALLQAFQDVVRSEQEKKSQSATPEPTPARRAALWVLFAVAASLLAILVTQPGWLFPRRPEETPALREASLRVRMFVEIDRVERFRADSGRFPSTLQEAGADTSGLTYTLEPGGYTLRGVNGELSLTYRSGASPREFLGTSYRTVMQRGKS